jgi:hypothetical protein
MKQDEYIQLNRSFREIASDSSASDEADISLPYVRGEQLLWPDLLKEYRVIVLSEAGSGKTSEIRHAARLLLAQGKAAFFLRLESVANSLESSFEEGTYDQFNEWLASAEEGWLFLDSVDESRLRHPRDFECSVCALGTRINKGLERAHIVITGRANAWRPVSDLSHCAKCFPFKAIAPEQGSANKEEEARQTFKFVALHDLDRERITTFLKYVGVDDYPAFLDAIDRSDAWSFTARPQDLKELAEFWMENGRIGNRTELIQNSINQRLRERDQGRAETYPLSADRGREGATRLAAATVLTQTTTIQIPDGDKTSNALPVHVILANWGEKDIFALLSRPVFDEAIYGAVRFHHRTVREYLAAEWFSHLLNRGVSRRSVERLFFRSQYGIDFVTPALRPLLPWLVLFDEKIRDRVRILAPEVFFEGGDPTQLPLDIRREILRKICQQMAADTRGGSVGDYFAVQRFAHPDLSEEVGSLLRLYVSHCDIAAFLLRMIWLGQMTQALPDALAIALNGCSERYVRLTAFRAVKAIGARADIERVRMSFLNESDSLNRVWLGELVMDLQPNEANLTWLLSCLEKSAPKERFSVDPLMDHMTTFVREADINLLPAVVSGLNRLLQSPPVIERRFCETSSRHVWLLTAAAQAIERLIIVRHPAALDSDSLRVIHMYSTVGHYHDMGIGDAKTDFTEHVRAWEDLNRRLFWFEASEARKALDRKSGEKLTTWTVVSIFGSFCWKFEAKDFEYVLSEISRQDNDDDKLVALSLAFTLYREAKRPCKWRERLKVAVKENATLSVQLARYLKPHAMTTEERQSRRDTSKIQKRAITAQTERDKSEEKWMLWLRANTGNLQSILKKQPDMVTNTLRCLYDRVECGNRTSDRWARHNWQSLTAKYGDAVARYYRDASVSIWRHHVPTLRSEGAPLNQTSIAVLVGLSGVSIEYVETPNWVDTLKPDDVIRACRYATCELNGFPNWFQTLYETHRQSVLDFVMKEIRFEMSIESENCDPHYIIDDVNRSGQWMWNDIAPEIYPILSAREPIRVNTLEHFLTIVQGSDIPDDSIASLARNKCATLDDADHLARWFAVWTGVAPDKAIPALMNRFAEIDNSDAQTKFAMIYGTQLFSGPFGNDVHVRKEFVTPQHLKTLYLLMSKHIRHAEDISRGNSGAYTPELRDYAQRSRDEALRLLRDLPGKASYLTLREIASLHPDQSVRPWILHQARTRAEQDGNISPWKPQQVSDFYERLERTPRNHGELAELLIQRLNDLKEALEQGDNSIAAILQRGTEETEVRNYVGYELRERANNRYSVVQEEELADAKKPDLRVQGIGFDSPVPIELKLADRWSGAQLFERLKNQLCGDYLRDNRSRRGVFLLIYRGDKQEWVVPASNQRVDFAGITAKLNGYWQQQLSPLFPDIDEITVLGIDLKKRSAPPLNNG